MPLVELIAPADVGRTPQSSLWGRFGHYSFGFFSAECIKLGRGEVVVTSLLVDMGGATLITPILIYIS